MFKFSFWQFGRKSPDENRPNNRHAALHRVIEKYPRDIFRLLRLEELGSPPTQLDSNL